MMPRPDQSMEAYLHECAVQAGEFLPRATPEQIEELKAKGYKVNEFLEDPYQESDGTFTEIAIFGWSLDEYNFQDDEPSLKDEDAWAGALQHSKCVDEAAKLGKTFNMYEPLAQQ